MSKYNCTFTGDRISKFPLWSSRNIFAIIHFRKCLVLPFSVDLERSYTDDPDELNGHIQKRIDIGCVAGINLEDALGEEIYLKKLTGVKKYLKQTDQQMFINSRTDLFLLKKRNHRLTDIYLSVKFDIL